VRPEFSVFSFQPERWRLRSVEKWQPRTDPRSTGRRLWCGPRRTTDHGQLTAAD
jgi:hypothetical protein